jgi:hypothetical protein
MKDISLMYVSRSTLSGNRAESDEIERIVETSVRRNAADNITGALIFTGSHFAQILEGPEAHVLALMKRVTEDTRHTHVDVVDNRLQANRVFPDWSLAYAGLATYVQRHVKPLLRVSPADNVEPSAVKELRRLMFMQVTAVI